MNRESARLFCAAALVTLCLPASHLFGQTQVPAVPAQSQAPASQTQPGTTAVPPMPNPPAAPAPSGPPVFPKPDPANFTAASPTKETVNAFLDTNWGYDPNRIWQVQAILKTQVPNVSKVIVFVGDKTGKEKPAALEFFVLPDGSHIITGDQIVSFGANPYADTRALMQQKADGPYRGVAAKDLELVEFADFQCPHCKEAQANMDKLVADYPKARIVFQNDPIPSIHPESMRAAEYGVCVTQMGGSTAFFQYAAAVFDGQDGLSTPDGATLTLNSATTKAGLDPAKVSACAALPATKAAVEASRDLATDIGVNEVPTLVINGRSVPANIPYDLLKRIIDFQAKRDGVTP
ncbi:MAG: DsbA family protein [Acidobacteriota bacterium]